MTRTTIKKAKAISLSVLIALSATILMTSLVPVQPAYALPVYVIDANAPMAPFFVGASVLGKGALTDLLDLRLEIRLFLVDLQP